MIRASAFPTVEWLNSRAADRPPAVHRARRHDSQSDHTGVSRLHVSRRALVECVARRLRESTAPGVAVRTDEWVVTPEGEQPVDIVMRGGDRCIGILVDRRYEPDMETLDALCLVYGHFDTLYRIGRHDPERTVNDLVYAIASDRRTWFTRLGWLNARRGASRTALLEGPGLKPAVERSRIRRMRLSRANEWVRAFERALAPNACDEARRRPDIGQDHPEGHSEQD